MAKKSLGQHFLKNKSAVHAIAKALDSKKNETIIEIGPGHGELTGELLGRNPESHIIAIEKDASLCAELRTRFSDAQITVLEGDALKILPELAAHDSRTATGDWLLAGNIPYYITGHLVRIISELPKGKIPKRCVFTIQREVAERIIAEAPEMNRLAASVAYWADAKIIMNLSAEDFSPAPSVSSAIILLNRKENPAFPDENRYYAAVRGVFSQPRKIILNNIHQAQEAKNIGSTKATKEKLAGALQDIGVLPESRPQDLSIEEIAKITAAFF